MEFNEKLQELRKQKGLTQEELAQAIYVSRAAVSKWESARGYPNIDSLKAIAKFFRISIDELLSGDELLSIAEEDKKQSEKQLRGLIFGMLDFGVVMVLFLPLFGESSGDIIQAKALLFLSPSWLKTVYLVSVACLSGWGLFSLFADRLRAKVGRLEFWKVSLLLNTLAALLFIISLQPYASVLLFTFLMIKVLLLIKWR